MIYLIMLTVGALIAIPLFNILGKGVDSLFRNFGGENNRKHLNSPEYKAEEKEKDRKDKNGLAFYGIVLIIIIIIIFISYLNN